MKRILFTGNTLNDETIASYFKKGYEFIPAPYDLSEDEIADILKDCDGYILGGDEIVTESMLQKAGNRLKAISFFGVGYEKYIDTIATKKHNIMISNTPGANANSVAELTVALILACVKDIVSNVNLVKQGKWARPLSPDLRGKTIGIIGMGNIGQIVTRILFNGFGMNVVYTSRRPKLELENLFNTQMLELEDLLKVSDIISLHTNLTDETKDMIGDKEFSLMKDNVILVNTTRAEIVKEDALLNALNSKKVFRCAFDCFYKEPITPSVLKEHPLLSNPNFIMSPHMGYYTKSAIFKMEKMAIYNIIQMLNNADTGDESRSRPVVF